MWRPAFLIALATACLSLLVACGDSDSGEPEITETPKNPLDAAERWLELWKDERYEQMYGLVAPDVQAEIDQETFVGRYEAISDEAKLTSIDYEVRTSDPQATEVEFRVMFHSDFFGDWPQVNVIPLVRNEVPLPTRSPGEQARTETQWRVQWTPSLFFKELTDETLVHFFTRVPTRGTIYDRNGNPLGVDAELSVVGIVPDLVADKEATIAALTQALGLPDAEVRAQVETTLPSYYFIPVKTLPYGTSSDEVQSYRDMVGLGVLVQEQTQRYYPNGPAAAHVLGYMTEVTPDQLETLALEGFQPGDLIGAAGLEGQYNDLLSGKRGGLLATITPQGGVDQTIVEEASEPGSDIFLTLNIGVQRKAEAELGERVGALIVMDPHDNSVLAMASFPRFDPNAFIRGLTSEEANSLFNDPRQPFLNRAVLAQYPPGSTFKVVTAAAGLEKGGYTPNSTLPCPPVWTGLGADYAQNNWQTIDRGYLSPAEGLMASCDPVFYEMAKTLDEIDEDLFPDFIRQFGYGSPTGIGIEEAAGNVPDPAWKEENVGEAWFRGDAVNMGIGQGYVTATPLQTVNVYSAIAGDGTLRKPLLVKSIGQQGTTAVQEYTAEVIHPLPVSQTTLDTIRYGLYLVTQSTGGTSYNAWAGSSLDVAGKSGTAEDLSQGSDHVFFVAYANRSDPSVVAIGALEEGESGSAEVAPMLRHIMESYLAGEFG